MTTLSKRKTKVQFTTSATYRGKELVVEAMPFYLTIRQKGARQSFPVPWDVIFEVGAKIEARTKREQ